MFDLTPSYTLPLPQHTNIHNGRSPQNRPHYRVRASPPIAPPRYPTDCLCFPRLVINSSFSCTPGGIGNSLAREFHARGLRVFATARSKESIRDLNEDLGIECLSLEVDQVESVAACFEEVQGLVGDSGLDYLVNNAGRSELRF